MVCLCLHLRVKQGQTCVLLDLRTRYEFMTNIVLCQVLPRYSKAQSKIISQHLQDIHSYNEIAK